MAEFMTVQLAPRHRLQGGCASQALAWAASNGIGTGSPSADAVTRSRYGWLPVHLRELSSHLIA